ncbi:MAG: hypothetical protein QXV69_05375 [Sulfolobaceae archaeon]
MFKELLGDYDKKGESLKILGKFIAFGLDDPFHITTFTGLVIYGIGKMRERSTNYGIRMMKLEIRSKLDELYKLKAEINLSLL